MKENEMENLFVNSRRMFFVMVIKWKLMYDAGGVFHSRILFFNPQESLFIFTHTNKGANEIKTNFLIIFLIKFFLFFNFVGYVQFSVRENRIKSKTIEEIAPYLSLSLFSILYEFDHWTPF